MFDMRFVKNKSQHVKYITEETWKLEMQMLESAWTQGSAIDE